MDDELRFLRSAITDALSARHPADWHPPDDGSISWESWRLCTQLGWDYAGLPQELGGLGPGAAPLVLLARTAGEHRLPLPLVETALARWAVASGRLDQPGDGEILTTPFHPGAGHLDVGGGANGVQVTGRLRAVPWARYADRLVVAGSGVSLLLVNLRSGGVRVDPGLNFAGEARDDVTFQNAQATQSVGEAGRAVADRLVPLAALMRTAQIAGAMDQALALTRTHTRQRTQFGRPLARFQLVGAHLAAIAAQVELVDAALADAIRAHDAGQPQPATASAALIAARAATEVARAAHQCHGAMGVTREYRLHEFTRRLWSWRDESGGERVWSRSLGELVLAGSRQGLWIATTPEGGLP